MKCNIDFPDEFFFVVNISFVISSNLLIVWLYKSFLPKTFHFSIRNFSCQKSGRVVQCKPYRSDTPFLPPPLLRVALLFWDLEQYVLDSFLPSLSFESVFEHLSLLSAPKQRCLSANSLRSENIGYCWNLSWLLPQGLNPLKLK